MYLYIYYQCKGSSGNVSELVLRIRLTEKTFNINLPPFSLPNAEFVKQQEIEDDGEPPRQVVCVRVYVCVRVCVCVCVCTYINAFIEDDGEPPRQFAHFPAWLQPRHYRVPNVYITCTYIVCAFSRGAPTARLVCT